MLDLRGVVQKFTNSERQEKIIMSRFRWMDIFTVEDLRWATIEGFRESRCFGPFYLGMVHEMIKYVRGE